MDLYYTIYMKTNIGMGGALIASCNHPNVHRINLSAITDNADGKYVIGRREESDSGQKMTEQDVNAMLLGLDNTIRVNEVSRCLKRGIAFGVVTLDQGLDTVLVKGQCLCCSNAVSCTVRDALYQPDYGGDDYCPCDHGAVECKGEDDCGRFYVTGMCNGMRRIDSGKYHNHCNECDGLGECQGDSRNAHCYQCGEHYFAGSWGRFRCQSCYPDKNDRMEDSDEGALFSFI